MLLAQIQCKLVHQSGLVCAGVDLSAADVVWVGLWIAINKLLAFWCFVNNAIVFGAVNWQGRLGKQNRNVTVATATFALFIGA